ncbi:MAG: glycosyltransferase family 9 protein [Methylotenera sp.]|nr:glycosyltransferase family 9 protein [Methylotenera sp.]
MNEILLDSRIDSKKTLVIQPLPGIGDMVWYLPYIHAIAEVDEAKRVDVFTKKRSMAEQLFDADASVANVLWFDDVMTRGSWFSGVWNLVKLLRKHNYQRVWVLHESPRYALVAMLAGIPERYGYGLSWQSRCLNKGVYLSALFAKAHPIDKANEFFRLNQIKLQSDVPKIVLNEAKVDMVKVQMHSAQKPWIALGIGSSEDNRQWGEENFTQLAKQILQAFGGTLFILCGPAEQMSADHIKQGLPEVYRQQVVNVIAQPLSQVCALLSLSDVFVGNDTGMLNVSAATGVPSFGLFGVALSHRLADESRNIYAIFPNEVRDEVVDKSSNNSMSAITVSSVMAKIEQLLKK